MKFKIEEFSNDFENNYWHYLQIKSKGNAAMFQNKENTFKKSDKGAYINTQVRLAYEFYSIGSGKLVQQEAEYSKWQP